MGEWNEYLEKMFEKERAGELIEDGVFEKMYIPTTLQEIDIEKPLE